MTTMMHRGRSDECPRCLATGYRELHVCPELLPAEPQTADNRTAHFHRTDDAERITALEKRVSDAEWEIRDLLVHIEKLESVRQEAGCALSWCPACIAGERQEWVGNQRVSVRCHNCSGLRDALRDAEKAG